MRSVSFIVLLAVAFGFIVPPLVPMVAHDESPMIGNIDICNSAVPALSSSGEMPFVSARLCNFAPTVSVSTYEPVHPRFTELIFTAPNEHPPKT